MSDNTIDLVIRGKQYTLDVEEIELGEAELIENELDRPLEEIDWRRASAIRCLAYVLLRRDDPAFTMAQARQLKVSDFDGPEPEDEADGSDPTPPVSSESSSE